MSHKKFSDFEYIVDQIVYGNEVKIHVPRDYQDELSHEICSFVDEGLSGELFVATGGGKTKIANDSILEMLNNREDSVFLWITKDWRLIKQAICSYLNLDPENGIDTLATYGSPENTSQIHDQIYDLKKFEYQGQRLIYSCINSINKEISELSLEIENFCEERRIAGIFIDESHHGKTGKMARKIYSFANKKSISVIGLSATPNINQSKESLIGEGVTIEELIDQSYLVPPVAYLKDVPVEWKPKFRNKIITEESITNLCKLRGFNQAFLKCLRDPNQNWGRSLVFAGGIDHAKHLTDLINKGQNGMKADYIHSKRNSSDIDRVIRSFREGDIDVLVNVEMATTGMDFDFLDTIFLLRPTSSPVLFLQMIGRGTRPFKGKDSFNFVDFTYTFAENEEYLINTLEMLERYFGNHFEFEEDERVEDNPPNENIDEYSELLIEFSDDSAIDAFERLNYAPPTLVLGVLNSLKKVELVNMIQESIVADVILEDCPDFETTGMSALSKSDLIEYIIDHTEELNEIELVQAMFDFIENELEISPFSIMAKATNYIIKSFENCTLDGAICLNMNMEEMRSYLYNCSKYNEIFIKVVDLLIDDYGYEEILFSGMSFSTFNSRYVENQILEEELREAIYRVSQSKKNIKGKSIGVSLATR